MGATLVKRPELNMNLPSHEPITNSESAGKRTTTKPPRPRGRFRALVAVVVVVVGLGGVWAYSRFVMTGKNEVASPSAASENGQQNGKATLGFLPKGNGAANGENNSTAPNHQTVAIEVVPRCDILRLTGSLIADEESSVASNASGIAAEVRVDRGSIVRKNDVLVQIDLTDAKNNLAEGQAKLDELKARLGLNGNIENFDPEDQPEVRLAKASADLAASNLRRAKELIGKKVISDEVYDQTETEYELAQQRYRQALLLIKQAYAACKTAMAKLTILEKAVADTTIRAPMDGWVAEKLVSVGEQISSGMQATKVVTLVRIDPLRLSLTVPQQDMGSIQPGQKVRFHVDSFPDQTFVATVRFIAPVVDNTRSMVVEAVVPNPEGMLRPGLFATAELELKRQQPGLYVPLSAVQKNGEVGRVFVVRDGVAREQVVALGEQTGGKIEIRSGLTGKELLAAHPELVSDGDKVGP